MHAASRHNVYAHGITLSREQAEVAAERIKKARLEQSCQAELLDYRKAPDSLEIFDKIASIGMFEHVGLRNLPLYFQTAYRLLKPGGVFLNHGIARAQAVSRKDSSFLDRFIVPFLRDVLLLRPPRNATFIGKYVFPNGELATISQAARAAERVGFEIRDVENLREHYELTLRSWVESLRANSDALLNLVQGIPADFIGSTALSTLTAQAESVKKGLDSVQYSLDIYGRRVKVSPYEEYPDFGGDVRKTFEKFQDGAGKR